MPQASKEELRQTIAQGEPLPMPELKDDQMEYDVEEVKDKALMKGKSDTLGNGQAGHRNTINGLTKKTWPMYRAESRSSKRRNGQRKESEIGGMNWHSIPGITGLCGHKPLERG